MFPLGFLLLLCLVASPLHADPSSPSYTPKLDQKYSGGFPDDYPLEADRVRVFLAPTKMDVSSRLGLVQATEGFQHPVTIRFDDGAPALSENPFFYVRTSPPDQGFSQELVVNVEAYAHAHHDPQWKQDELRDGFHYAMTELILNDLTGAQTDTTLSPWVQEGLAIYISGMGDEFVKKTAQEVPRSKTMELVGELNRPLPFLTKREYARFYLAINYIVDTGGVSILQAFVRDVLNGKSGAQAVLDVLGQDWTTFEKNVRDYSFRTFQALTVPDEEFESHHDSR